MRWQLTFAALAGSAILASGVHAATPPDSPVVEQKPHAQAAEKEELAKVTAARTFRASKLSGLNVRNKQGDVLGEINDFVIDLKTGQVQYAAMSVGGIFGFGDKLLAVPFSKLSFDHGQNEMFFVLDMPKEKIAAARGFDQSNWPEFADPNWSQQIEKHYRQTEVRTGKSEESSPE